MLGGITGNAKRKSFETEAIHGSGMKDACGALITPIYNASTFIFDSTAQGAARFALGGARSAVLMREFWNYDLRSLGNKYKMPVYYVMGDRDRTTPFEIAREYFDALEAPRKAWYFVPRAGHFAMLDNTAAWREIMRDIAPEA